MNKKLKMKQLTLTLVGIEKILILYKITYTTSNFGYECPRTTIRKILMLRTIKRHACHGQNFLQKSVIFVGCAA
jgi:hypothetical protein